MRIDHSVRPASLLDVERTNAGPSDCGCPGHEADLAEDLSKSFDQATVRYVLATRPHFEGLRQAASQLAGLMVLAAAGAKSVTQEHAMLRAARCAHAEAVEGLAAARVPPRASHHHRHLTEASSAIGLALARASESMHRYAAGSREIEPALAPLRRGYRHLQWASAALPGFELIDFQQACCAAFRQERS